MDKFLISCVKRKEQNKKIRRQSFLRQVKISSEVISRPKNKNTRTKYTRRKKKISTN